MRKTLAILGIILLVAIAAAWYFLTFRFDSVLQTEIERAATVALGSRVEISGVETNIRDGSVTIDQVAVANPPGFDNPYAMRFHQVEAAVDYASRDIRRIIIDRPEFLIEEKDGRINVEQMLQTLQAGPADAGPAEGAAAEPIITIRHFRINQTRAAFESKSFDRYTDVSVDAVELHDLRGTPTELARLIAAEVVEELTAEAATELLKAEARKKLGDIESRVGERLRGLLGRGLEEEDSPH